PPPSSRRWLVDERVFAASLALIFLMAATFNVWHHQMWRDETLNWQFVAASPNLVALYRNLRYAGVPLLWYLVIWPLPRLTSSLFAMQFLHVLIAAGTVFFFALRGPFGRVI